MAAIARFDIPGARSSISCTYPNRTFHPLFRLSFPRLPFLQPSVPSLPHAHSWADALSSPLNPEMFAHLSATGVLGDIAGTLNSLPPTIASPAHLQPPFPLVDAHDSRQDNSSNSPFASPSHPYQKVDFQDHSCLASSPYDSKPKLRRPGVPDISPPAPLLADAKRNGLSDGKSAMRGGVVGTHSRQGSSGEVSQDLVFLFPITLKI
jgi:hypothetical protein